MLQADVLVVENEQQVFTAMIALKEDKARSPMPSSLLSAQSGLFVHPTFDHKALRLPVSSFPNSRFLPLLVMTKNAHLEFRQDGWPTASVAGARAGLGSVEFTAKVRLVAYEVIGSFLDGHAPRNIVLASQSLYFRCSIT